jgi:hypothetical protein
MGDFMLLCGVNEIGVLLEVQQCNGSFVPTFKANLSVPSSRVLLEI